ncbi:sensor histidine kinase KdpD [Gemmobacter lutimaris]|uniref:histidine kinase n=1 Tax=Gemmobacter lutimaris TaxID=2306023 RepID=A0A398BUE4_9RHOB|nr:sensor histidine kinase KdpD [Gemmobacter lutimaris]RID91490.1 sensor histidine kinase KdpD [Gemmobacter lutimaris]
MTEETRPSPDALLREAEREGRGTLKIFLGAAPGVGKTYEMLLEGAEKCKAGKDVVIGIVETHGRKETEALVAPLPVVPRKELVYRGQTLTEMDIDAVLERHPQIVLVDELAHTNAQGSRHPKRWQDIEELLAAGIDVMTTVNIQHVESLNDVVGSFTHVRVRETVPDKVFENAEIELIDLPPEDLIVRLEAGKIYVPEQAAQALDHFFSKGNLLALRELALRHAAHYVDARIKEHQGVTGKDGYGGGQRVLVAISEAAGGEQVVRAAKRLADALKAPLIALFVETPSASRLSDAEKTQLARILSLASSLGATLQSVPATAVQEAILAQCKATRATQLVIGSSRHGGRGFPRFRQSIVKDLIDRSSGVSVHVVPLAHERRADNWRHYVPKAPFGGDAVALGAVGLTTLVLFFAQDWISRGPIDMLYLVPVIVSASYFGFRAGLVAAVAAGIAYNFFFLQPFYTFIIYGPANIITAMLLVVVAIITGQLAAQARAAAALAMRSARENAALARFATRLSAASETSETAQIVCDEIRTILAVQTIVLHSSGDGVKITASGQAKPELSPVDRAAAEWAFEHGEAAGRGTNTLTASDWQFRPLKTSLGTLAVLGLRSPAGRDAVPTERAALAESLIDQAALAHERLKLEADMREMEVVRQRDSLRAALLASLSHDLRTPLTVVTAAAEALSASGDEAELVETLRSEARRLNRFLSDLLDLTRIEEGAVTPDLQPIDLTDAITSALADLAGPLEGRKLQTMIDPNLPLVRADAVLLHHAILNLIDNAVKYSPEDETIEVVARMGRRGPVIDVLDRGPGIPQGSEQRIFDRFARGETSDRTGGSGLGLAIVKGFSQAMGFTVEAARRQRGGSRFTIRIPPEAIVQISMEGMA